MGMEDLALLQLLGNATEAQARVLTNLALFLDLPVLMHVRLDFDWTSFCVERYPLIYVQSNCLISACSQQPLIDLRVVSRRRWRR